MVTMNGAGGRLAAILISLAIIVGLTHGAPAAAVSISPLVFQGAWVNTTVYAAGAIVTYNGASYVSLVQNSNVTPGSNARDWTLLDAPGATGPQGPAGPTGATGAAGATGPRGPAGATGAQGPQGLVGVAGSMGPTGPAGAQGATGATGAPGPAGPTGPTGATGPEGLVGPAGQPGLTGAMGPAGPQGLAGPIGPAGPTGTQGATGPIGSVGSTGAQGAAGPAGPTGASLTFLGAWNAATAYAINDVATENGSAYVVLTANTGVDPANDATNAGGNWTVFAVSGALGAAGATGAAGAPGAPGPVGPAGSDGAAGAAGPQGSAGPAGAAGATGATGDPGPAGIAGPNGTGIPACSAPNSYLVFVQGGLVCQPRFNVNGDGTLTDNQTRLMWELQTSTCGGEVTCANNQYSWSTGDNRPDGTLFTNFLAALNSSASSDGSSTCYANHCNWRIPTIADLQTIIETSASGCGSGSSCIDPAFGPTAASCEWASTTVAGLPANAWDVGFGTGLVESGGLKSSNCAARAVRGGR